MAQERLFVFRQEDSTYDMTRVLAHILIQGLYVGFDFIPGAGLNLVLNHSVTGQTYLDSDGLTTRGPFGIFRTQQGMTVVDDTIYSLPLNSPVTDSRIDAIIAEHKYLDEEGGQVAEIQIVEGAESLTPVKPTIDPSIQTVLGWVTLPAGVTDLTDVGVSYERNDVGLWNNENFDPSIYATIAQLATKADQVDLDALAVIVDGKQDASDFIAFTNIANRFTKMQKFSKGTITTATLTDLNEDGNYFTATAGTIDGFTIKDDGTEIEIRATDTINLRHNQSTGNPSFLPIFNPRGVNVVLINNDIVRFRQDGGFWYLTQQPASGLLPRGSIIMWSGATVPSGWALCDGQTVNGIVTPNMQGRIPAGFSTTAGDYDAVAKTGGADTISLTEAQMPEHQHGAGTLQADALGSEHQHDYGVPNGDSGSLGGSGNDAWNSNLDATNQTDANTTSQHTHTISGSTADAGSGDPVDIRQPYYVLKFIIKVV